MSARKTIIELVRSGIMRSLMPLERRELRQAADAIPPICFIVGPPRSGTTLLYEMMLTRFHLAYFSNFAHRFYLTPVMAARLGRRWTQSWQGHFESRYGHIAGWGAPNEGGWIWNRWFPESSYLDERRAASLPTQEIRATVAGTAAVMGGPFLNKNVMHSVHMRLLDSLFPNCVFVELQRDPVANARSILRARQVDAGPTADGWWSVKPKQWERYREETHAIQAAAQVHFLHRNIDEDAAHLGAERRMVVDYEALCSDPHTTLDGIGGFLRSAGFALVDRALTPQTFDRGSPQKLEPALEAELRAALESVIAA